MCARFKGENHDISTRASLMIVREQKLYSYIYIYIYPCAKTLKPKALFFPKTLKPKALFFPQNPKTQVSLLPPKP